MRWTIYKKDGTERMVQWSENVAEPAKNFALPDLEYNGEWMGETSVTLNIRCAVPVDFEIGDYIIYRGEKFVINYNPTVIKKARRGTYGEGFTYSNVKFNSLGNELADARMLDYVINDNEIHYSGLPKFPFFCATVDDLADRLQVNMNRYCDDNDITGDDRWLFVTPDNTRTLRRASASGISTAHATEVWNQYYGGSDADIRTAYQTEKVNQNVSIDNQSVWDAMKNIKDVFGLNFVNKGRVVAIGTAGLPTMDIFKYGKGNGLYEIERTADSDQQIVTKLMAYGSDKNLPTRYYASLNAVYYMTIDSIEEHGNDDTQDNYLLRYGVCQVDSLFKVKTSQQDGWLATTNAQIEGESTWTEVTVACNTNRSIQLSIPCASWQERLTRGTRLYFSGNIDGDKWPDENKSYATDNLPNNMAVNVLMLPGFPNQSLYDWVKANGGTSTNDATGIATWHGHTAYFSKDAHQPYILSQNYTELGIREATKYFDGSDNTDEIYPTIQNTGKDAIVSADVIQDNGVFADGAEIPTFKIILPDFGSDFKLDELLQSDTVISMKDGYCGGREFSVSSAKKLSNGTWECTCQRDRDDSLDLWFPYAHGAAGVDMPYQLRSGDKYVLTGIEMTSTYVEAAASTLLEAALTFLEANDYTRYTYAPKVDELFMARQHDGYTSGDTSTYGTRSYYETIKEGDVMLFEDEDLNIDGSVFIDTLRIKEYGNGQIPTYDVTLRNDKQVGTIQRLQDQVNSITSTGGGGYYGGGGMNIPQIRQLIQTYGKQLFVSKTGDDEASGLIGFLKGIYFGAQKLWGITQDGIATLKSIVLGNSSEAGSISSHDFRNGIEDGAGWSIWVDENGNSHLQVDALDVRKKMFVTEIEIKKKTYTAGNLSLGQAGNRIVKVEPLDSDGYPIGISVFAVPVYVNGVFSEYQTIAVETGTQHVVGDTKGRIESLLTNAASYKCYFLLDDGETRVTQDWRLGDMAKCRRWNIEEGVHQNVSNRYYWRLVIGTGSEELEDGNMYGYVILANHDMYIYSDSVLTPTNTSIHHQGEMLVWGYDPIGTDIPMAGDDIVQEGNPIDTSRQGLIVLDVAEGQTRAKICIYEHIGSDTTSASTQYQLADNDYYCPVKLSPDNTRIASELIKMTTGGSTLTLDDAITLLQTGHFTVNGNTTFEGDVELKGLITNSTTLIRYDSEPWLHDQSTDVPATVDQLFIPIDMSTLKSITVQGISFNESSSSSFYVNTHPIVVLPTLIAKEFAGGIELPTYGVSGTTITIRNAYNRNYLGWSQSNYEGLRMTDGVMLVYTEGRLLNADNYRESYEGEKVRGTSIPYTKRGWSDGCAVLDGMLGRVIAVMPGQILELESSVEKFGDSEDAPSYLLWNIKNTGSYQSISGTINYCVYGSDKTQSEVEVTDNYQKSGDYYKSGVLFGPPELDGCLINVNLYDDEVPQSDPQNQTTQ